MEALDSLEVDLGRIQQIVIFDSNLGVGLSPFQVLNPEYPSTGQKSHIVSMSDLARAILFQTVAIALAPTLYASRMVYINHVSHDGKSFFLT